MKKFLKNRRGFTVVELVVVVLIIAVLIATAFPLYREARQEARQTAHDANVRKLYDAAELWVMRNPGVAAIWSADPGQKAGKVTAPHEGWMTVLREWPGNPLEVGGTYMVEITVDGTVSVTPEAGYYGE